MLRRNFLQYYELILTTIRFVAAGVALLLFLTLIGSRLEVSPGIGYLSLLTMLGASLLMMIVVELIGYFCTGEFYYQDKDAFLRAAKTHHGVKIQ